MKGKEFKGDESGGVDKITSKNVVVCETVVWGTEEGLSSPMEWICSEGL